MGERKVLNKYYPPDFDPSKIPRRRQPKNQQIKVRMMLPMSIRCNTCGNYIYKGTKFNSRKEDVIGETYLGIQILRFYFKCSRCSAELTMKTDPQNSDYVMETGATRNFEPWRAADEALDDAKKKRDAEELGDAMKALENRTLDSKQEMDILAALDEMKSMRARHASVGTTEMLEALRRTAESKDKQLEEEDEALLRSVVFQNSSNFVRRLTDDDELDDGSDYEEEEDLQQQDRKRRKGGLASKNETMASSPAVLEGSNEDEEEKSPSQASKILEPASESQPPKGKTNDKKAAFAIRPNPVKFAVKPKAKATGEAPPAIQAGKNGTVSQEEEDGDKGSGKALGSQSQNEEMQIPNVDANPTLGLASLCSTYDTSDSE
ncbi:hypothetical protein R1flu_027120 [Riccia fluitans]|uniref:Splicing factor YJU2 n=1 Tax=Riccia fluitans TaxID=41844 RepID=A0ABD1XHW8_9MARC